MKKIIKTGSQIGQVHNGLSLFTISAGMSDRNIHR
jgi:hypothetical protein